MKIFATLISIAFASSVFAQRLLPIRDVDQDNPLQTLDGEILTMTTWNDKLIVGGSIESINNLICNDIFAWNGSSFEQLGEGWSDGTGSQRVECLTTLNDGLLAAGRINFGNGNESRIRSFDGNSWANFTDVNFGGNFSDLLMFQGQPAVSGWFNDAFNYVALYNGSEWVNIGATLNGPVLDLEVYDDELYACGEFTLETETNTTLNYIAKWDGNNWIPLDSGVDNRAFTMAVADGVLVVGGEFSNTMEGMSAGHLVKWDNSNLMPFEYSTSGEVVAVVNYQNEIIYVEEDGDVLGMHLQEGVVRYRGMFGPIMFRSPTLYVHDDQLMVAVENHSSLMDYSTEYPDLTSGLMYIERGTDEVYLNVNNCNVPITPLGTFFSDPLLEVSRYEVPAGSGVSMLYAASLWATAINGQGDQLAAATTYSTDKFGWTFGPISDNMNLDYLKKYHRVWKVTLEQITQHQNNFQNLNYTMPEAIENWPGNGNVFNGEAQHLASFQDVNQNGWYEPQLGDYPIISGDECVYIILNDHYLQSTFPSSFQPMDLEAHVMFYGYSNEVEPIESTLFMKVKVFNRSDEDYTDFRISSWSDFDLGTPTDDYIGSDSIAMISYSYNGDGFDEATTSSPGYELFPPAFGNVFLSDDMGAVSYFQNSSHPEIGEPILPGHFFNYARGVNKIGEDFVYYGVEISPFAFNGDICVGTGESESNLQNPAGDRRSVASSVPFNLDAGDAVCFEMAYVYYQQGDNSNLENACGLLNSVPELRNFYNNNIPVCAVAEFPSGTDEKVTNLFNVYPNPAHDLLTLESTNRSISSYTITDALGKVVVVKNLPFDVSRENVPINQLPQGVYFLKLNMENYTGVVRFVKN